MAHEVPEIDPALVEIADALDRHERVRMNSIDPQQMRRAATELNTVVHRNAEDDATVEEYLAESREPEWRNE